MSLSDRANPQGRVCGVGNNDESIKRGWIYQSVSKIDRKWAIVREEKVRVKHQSVATKEPSIGNWDGAEVLEPQNDWR